MKKRGFATTAVMYTILLLFLVLLIGILNNTLNRKTILDQLKAETKQELEDTNKEEIRDKEVPTVSVVVNGKTATLTLKDNIGLSNYTVTDSEDTPTDWEYTVSGTNSEQKWAASKAGTYYVHVKDAAGNTAYKEFDVVIIDLIDPSLWSYTNTAGTYGKVSGTKGSAIAIGQSPGAISNNAYSGIAYSSYVDITNMNTLNVTGNWQGYGSSEYPASTASFVVIDESGKTLFTIYSGSTTSGSEVNVNKTIDVSSYTGKVRLKGTFSTYNNFHSLLKLTTCEFY